MIAFISLWRLQVRAVDRAPAREILIIQGLIALVVFSIMGMIRISPYPPSFSKMAAKIMDPSMGASTCALGNHRCKVNMGSLARNANVNRRGRGI